MFGGGDGNVFAIGQLGEATHQHLSLQGRRGGRQPRAPVDSDCSLDHFAQHNEVVSCLLEYPSSSAEWQSRSRWLHPYWVRQFLLLQSPLMRWLWGWRILVLPAVAYPIRGR